MNKLKRVLWLIAGILMIAMGVILLIVKPFYGVLSILIGIVEIICSRKVKDKVSKSPDSPRSKPLNDTVFVPQPRRSDMNISDYVVVDTETTGLDVTCDEIVELAALKVSGGIVSDTFSYLVKPRRSMPIEASRVNHITDDMLQEAADPHIVMSQFLKFAGGYPLVGYNISSFDFPLLDRYCTMFFNYHIQNEIIDVYALVKSFMPELPSKKLTSVADQLGVTYNNAHRALDDCYITFEVFKIVKDHKHSPVFEETDHIDKLFISGSVFVLTGDFKVSSKEELEARIIRRGGVVKQDVSKKVDYLLIGSLGSSRYKPGTYGTKVQKALDLKANGVNIKILSENDFLSMFDKGFHFTSISLSSSTVNESLSFQEASMKLMEYRKQYEAGLITQAQYEEIKKQLLGY